MTERNDNFYRETGWNAFRLGLNSFDNPYKQGDRRSLLWLEGYSEAKRKNARPMVVSRKPQPSVRIGRSRVRFNLNRPTSFVAV